MITHIHNQDIIYKIDLSQPLDISIPLRASSENVNAWYIPPPSIQPVTDGDWIGNVAAGASTNFNNISFNPHGHGTHTECVGHITTEFYSINTILKQFFFIAEVITVQPEKQGEDTVITKNLLKTAIQSNPEALIIRTLPNTNKKRSKHYSHTNWPYLTAEAASYICELGVKHLLIDLPSVDKEKDNGKLVAHKAFWKYPEATRYESTITELIYVASEVIDGIYLLNLQIASFENDATPSKPVLYKIIAQ